MQRRGRRSRSRSRIAAAIGAAVLVAMLPGAAAAAGSPPLISADAPSVTVDENHLAQLSGDWSDPDGDDVTVSASLGTVETELNGRWRWTYPALDGPFDATVTLTATDETDATTSIDIAFHVDNVPPRGWMKGPAFVPVNSKSSRSFLWSISDTPGDDPVIDVGCGSGTQTGAGDGGIVGQHWIACRFPTAGPTLVGPQATDKDGASVDARMTTVATTAVRSMADGRLVIDGAAEGDYVGSALAAVDLDDDGHADIAIGTAAPSYDFSFGDPGVISVVRGRVDSASLNLGSMPAGTSWTITGPPDVRFGSSLAAAGDVNGDGVGDLLVGSLAGDWVVFGRRGFSSVDVRTMASARGFAVTGTVVYEPDAQPLAGVGDVNGDGFDDIAVGSPAAGSGSGEVAVILGRAVPTNVDASAIPARPRVQDHRPRREDRLVACRGRRERRRPLGRRGGERLGLVLERDRGVREGHAGERGRGDDDGGPGLRDRWWRGPGGGRGRRRGHGSRWVRGRCDRPRVVRLPGSVGRDDRARWSDQHQRSGTWPPRPAGGSSVSTQTPRACRRGSPWRT